MRAAALPDKPADTAVGETRCQCGGLLVVFASDYVTWSHCTSCARSQLVAWMSCRPLALGGPPAPPPVADWRVNRSHS